MRQSHLKVRLLRAIIGKTQGQLAKALGVHPSLISQIEQGRVEPGRDFIQQMADRMDIAESDLEALLGFLEDLRQKRQQRRGGTQTAGRSREDGSLESVYRRLLALPDPGRLPRVEDRALAEAQWDSLRNLPEEAARIVVRIAEKYQNWALCERICDESVCQTSQDLERAATLSRLAVEIAEQVRGPEKWCKRLLGFATAHGPNVLRVAGELKAAEVGLEKAKCLWQEGADPAAWLDPGRLLDLEASLRRDQRRFNEALVLLDQAAAIGRSPERVLIKKGFTLEVMGEYEQAIETLLHAEPLVEALGDPRLAYMLRFNLAVNYCHVGRYIEAANLVQQVRSDTTKRGDKNEVTRVVWLEGRIAAGLGRSEEARRLLMEARQRFAAEQMVCDVALALLEEAVLLLNEGRTTEVKVLARELSGILEDKGVHREALVALRLFQEAAMREKATAEMARRVLRYLFRAQHDTELRFTAS